VPEQDESGKVMVGKAARSAKSGRQGERTDADVLDYIYAALQSRPNLKAAELHREMEADDRWRPLLPELRAFRGHVAETRQHIEQGRWSPAEANDEEARLVLPVIGRMREVEAPYLARQRELIADETGDPRSRRVLAEQVARMEEAGLMPFWVTPRVAKWIARLRRWIPDLEGAGDYVFPAWQYAAREARGAPTHDLDQKMAEIAARHWRGKGSEE
jgi:hypothetical protein